ncbi:unnamed protein product [Lepeophtheirus salmonis]|uniref:(salmon louse) hypothetical protein n=1 Tax=Lepeophtheirus salmonis TaxID=72036 RepID=A0A817FBL1_LEPSM|nr:unnamed protein product [Lepeophtheirus salmonis]CAG9475817.1 unnamed protein product [Lepeophtheirus salmonis]
MRNAISSPQNFSFHLHQFLLGSQPTMNIKATTMTTTVIPTIITRFRPVIIQSLLTPLHDSSMMILFKMCFVILVCSILLVVIVLSVAIVIWRRRKRFLRSLMNEEHKSGEDEDHPKLPPSNDIELHENPDGNKHVFSNPNYPQQTINIGGLPFYLLPATKDSNVDECEGSYVSSSVLTSSTTNSPIQPSSEQTPPPPLPSGPRGRSNMNISNASPNLPPDSAGPSSHCTTSSSEAEHIITPITILVDPFSTPRTPPARTGGVYYYSDTLRNNHKNGRNPQECESDSGISNSRTSTEEGTPPSRHALRGSGRKHPPPLPPTRRAVDTEVSVKPHKGSVQV